MALRADGTEHRLAVDDRDRLATKDRKPSFATVGTLGSTGTGLSSTGIPRGLFD